MVKATLNCFLESTYIGLFLSLMSSLLLFVEKRQIFSIFSIDQFWSPFRRKDIDLLEKVEPRDMVHGFSGLDYGERVRSLNMYSL